MAVFSACPWYTIHIYGKGVEQVPVIGLTSLQIQPKLQRIQFNSRTHKRLLCTHNPMIINIDIQLRNMRVELVLQVPFLPETLFSWAPHPKVAIKVNSHIKNVSYQQMLNHHHVCKHILVENLSKLTYDLWCHGLSVCMWVYLCQRQHVKVYFFSYKKTVKSVDELAADPSLELPLWFSQASIIFSPRCTVPKTSLPFLMSSWTLLVSPLLATNKNLSKLRNFS